jgi:dihydrofolate reductase
MSKVITGLAVSLDGYIAGPDDGPGQPLGTGGERLFEFFAGGDTPSRFYPDFTMSPVSAALFDAGAGRNGAVITGRRTYDIAHGWGGKGPMPGIPLFVMTHAAPDDGYDYTYVTDGIESAVAQATAAADGKDISLMGSEPVQQALRAGLLDEFELIVVPVLLGGGVRLLDRIGDQAIQLEKMFVVDTPDVTHMHYRVIR